MYIQARSSISIGKPIVDSAKAGDAIISSGITTSNPFIYMQCWIFSRMVMRLQLPILRMV